ncbi:RNA-directed DNA polymerase, eukaryota, reverse transcriptase zinc-binding domain protein [Tanacetum coccineum]
MEIVRNLLVVARDLVESLNMRKAIINEAKVNKNTTMVKSVAFFRDQQDQDLALKKGSSLIMVQWILQCVTSVSFSICVNGERFGYFKGGRGLRQGDPMSPYLFTLVMGILSLIVQKKVDEKKYVLKEAIEDIGVIFSLFPSYSKSSIIFESISMEDKQSILDSVPFKVEKLPMKYLGVPLTS